MLAHRVSRGLAAACLLLTSTLAAQAQAAPAKSPPPETSFRLDTFIVSAAEWGALQSATENHRLSVRLIDSIEPNDLGVLPDFNVGENLQRLPGISIDLDQAEARYVTVRGFSPN